MMTGPFLPRYGEGALADIVPSLLAALGVRGFPNVLAAPQARRVCLLLIDGLGWELLRAHAGDAPFLTELAAGAEPVTAGFPATTATSVTSIGTGLPPGEHGIVGYTFAGRPAGLVNALTWCSYGAGVPVDLREELVPEEFQPATTAMQRAAADGVTVRLAVPTVHRGSGLTRAALRGAELCGVRALGDLAEVALRTFTGGDRGFCYAYHGDLDLLGHTHGPGSLAWRLQLRQIDQLIATIADGLGPGDLFAITADHGMVALDPAVTTDVDTEPVLQHGIRLLGGDVRARHLYVEDGAAGDVAAVWRAQLGDRAWVVHRDKAIAEGWFGPRVADHVRPRIGDLLVVSRGRHGIVRSVAEPAETGLIGHHGSLTAEEQLIPFLLLQGDTPTP